METLLDGIPLERVSTSMTINATAAILLALYVAVARRRGDPRGRALGHGPERHPQGVRGARDLHLPARPVAAAGHRRVRLLRRAASRAGTRSRSPATTSARRGRRRRRSSPSPSRNALEYVRAARAAGLDPDALRRAALVLLRLPLRLRRGGGEVPRPRAGCGRGSCRSGSASTNPQAQQLPLPRADGRGHAHRAAARQQRGARGAAGAGRRAGRLPEPAHERQGRGARAAHRGLGAPGAAHAADHRATSRASRTRSTRSAASTRSRRPRTRSSARRCALARPRSRRAGGALRAIERGEIQRGDPGVGLPPPAAGGDGRARDRGREPLPRTTARRAPVEHPAHRPRRSSARRSSACARCGRGAPPEAWARLARRARERGALGREPGARRSSTPCWPGPRWARSRAGCAACSASTGRRSSCEPRPAALPPASGGGGRARLPAAHDLPDARGQRLRARGRACSGARHPGGVCAPRRVARAARRRWRSRCGAGPGSPRRPGPARGACRFLACILIYTNLHDTIGFVNPHDVHDSLVGARPRALRRAARACGRSASSRPRAPS